MPAKRTHDEFVELLKLKQPNLVVLSEYKGSYEYITVKCLIHDYTFESKPKWLLKNPPARCQKCYDERRGDTTRSGIENFILKAKEIHGDKYNYSKVEYVNNKTNVCIICPEHGEFWQRPDKHISVKHGCPKCVNKNVTTEEFIEKARKIHDYKYDYSKVNYVNNSTKIIIICPEHKEFSMTPDSHLGKSGCSKCAGTFMDLEYFIEKANKKHNNRYDYSKSFYVNKNTNICIICSEHDEFWQSPDNHLRGAGCPICKSSKIELIVNDILKEKEIEFVYEKKFDWLGLMSLDFYLPIYNIAIECQGGQHFRSNEFFGGEDGFIRTLERDVLKNKLCKENRIDLVYLMDVEEYSDDIMKNEIFQNIYIRDNLIIGKKTELPELLKEKLKQKIN